jgi:hypothetical protein
MLDVRILSVLLGLLILAAVVLAQSPTPGEKAAELVRNRLTAIIDLLRQISAPIGLALFMFAGAVYAGCQPLGKDMKMKGERWSISIIIGTAMGLIIVVFAPFLVEFLVGMGG